MNEAMKFQKKGEKNLGKEVQRSAKVRGFLLLKLLIHSVTTNSNFDVTLNHKKIKPISIHRYLQANSFCITVILREIRRALNYSRDLK